MRAIDRLVVGRTVLMISHRLSTLGNVDEIVVLQQGRIVERGTYTSLKRAGGVFAGLLEEQGRYSAERLAQGRGRVVVAAPALARAVIDAPRRPVPPPPSPDDQLHSILGDLRATLDDAFTPDRARRGGNGHGKANGGGDGHAAVRARRAPGRMAAEVADAFGGSGDGDPPASVLLRGRRQR
jgi:hypothetical protein